MAGAAAGAADEDLYDLAAIRTFSLVFDSPGFFSQLEQVSSVSGQYLVADLIVDGVEYPGVGVRFRGNTSQRNAGQKRSFKIAVDFTDPDQRLHGRKTLKLNNGAFDPTFLREVTYSRITHEYYPSPTANFVELELNGESWGLYLNVEHLNRDLLDGWFDRTKGHRWKAPSGGGTGGGAEAGGGGERPGGFASGDRALKWLGGDPATYQRLYELKSDPDDGTGDPWAALMGFCDGFNNPPLEALDQDVSRILDVDGALWAIALENVFSDEDGYIFKGADYAIFLDDDHGRIHLIQHDGNETFRDPAQWGLFQASTDVNRPIISRLLSIPHLRERYVAHVRTLLEEWLRWDVLGPQLADLHARLAPIVQADTKRIFSFEAFQSNLESTVNIGSGPGGGSLVGLREFVEQRRAHLLAASDLEEVPPDIGDIQLALDEVEGAPPEAMAGEPVAVRVAVSAPDPLTAVLLHHTDDPDGPYTALALADDGRSGDGAAGDGTYGGELPGYLAGAEVHYYVEARSSAASAFEPPRAERGSRFYRVAAETAESTPVVINELMALNEATASDPQGDFDDWVELRNNSAAVVDLGGMYLSDKETNPRKWRFPDGIAIPPGGYLVVWLDEDGEDGPADGEEPDPSNLHANFKLSGGGEVLLLADRDENLNQILDATSFDALPADRSWARLPDGSGGFTVLAGTPLAANDTGSAVPRFRRGDANDDGRVNLSDALSILGWLFRGDDPPGCVATANTNGDQGADITDAIHLLNHLFLGGAAIVAPYPDCGPGALPADEATCAAPPASCRE
jgi:hypothetical protein